MNVCTVTEDFEIIPFLFRAVPKPRIPNQRNYNGYRPSTRSTLNASSLRLNERARASLMSTPKELIPFLQKMLAVFLNKFHNLVDLHGPETSGTLEYNRIKPKLGELLFARFTWICAGSLRSKDTKKNRYPSTGRTVGILSPFYLIDAKQRSGFVAPWLVRLTGWRSAANGACLSFHQAKPNVRRLSAASWC